MKKLRLLFAVLALLGGAISASANQTLADNGVYYIQNVETGLFLSRGGWAGAHALADNYGLAWRLSGTNGSITLQMYDIYCEGFTTGGLGGDSFVDNGSPLSNWTLEGDANGYTIKTGSTYLTASGSTAGSDVVIDGNGTGNKTWILLNDAEHAAVLAAKTSAQESAIATTAGIDLGTSTLSEILGNTSNWRTSNIPVAAPTSNGVWTYTENRDQGGANNYGDYGTELYNKSGKFTKTITDLENGIYKLTVRSMHRSTHNAPCWTVGESFTNHTNSYVLANGYYAQLKDWKSAAEKNGNDYNPNGTGQFKTKVEAGNYATDIYTYVSNGTLDITVSQEGFWYGEWFAFNGVTLTYYSDKVSDDDATAILATATALEAQEMDADLLSALSSAKTTFDGAHTIANYNALQTAITAAQASADAYALFAPERTKALALGMTSEAIAALAPNVNNLKVAEYNFVTTTYSHAVELGTWNASAGTGTKTGQHWDGTNSSSYLEQSGENWGKSSWNISYDQDLSLPAGNYVFKVAGRTANSNGVSMALTVKNGETVLGTVNDFPKGDVGKGIDTSGATNFGDGTFANNGAGRGWEWRYVKFTLADPATINVAVTASATIEHMWVGFCNPTVQTDDADNVALMEALVALNSAKTAATLTKRTANVGTGVFQYNEATNESLWSAYSTAKSNAEAYELTSSSTASEVNDRATALTTAITNYQSQSLNAPDAEKRYNVSIVEAEKAWGGNAITFIAGGRADQGKYGVKYLAPANANLNQALKFTAVAGEANTYKVSAIRVENGSEQYLTTGSTYGGNNDQIRTTDDASKAMWIKIEPTSTDNQFQLRNMSANKIIANNNNNDMYTANSANFTIAEASQAEVAINIASDVKYATRIFPFTPVLPSGVVAYSCESTEGDVLSLEEVAEPVANTPYILYAENGYTGAALTGWGTAAATTATAGLLTGVYESTTATAGTYVLQNNNDKVAFYLVAEDEEPTVGANRCYLTKPAGTRAAYFFPGSVTGVENVKAASETEVKDGKYLENGKIVIVKNGVKYNAAGAQVK